MRPRLFITLSLIATAAQSATLAPIHPQCERQTNPLAVEAPAPYLSWQLQATSTGLRNLTQSAYQILAASSPKLLAEERGDLWNSGKMASSATYNVAYRGAAAPRVFWKVRVWDQAGKPSAWSQPATWSRALSAEEWKAGWIAGDATGAMPIFRHGFQLDKPVARAVLYISGLGQYEAWINGRRVGEDVLSPGWTLYPKTVFYNTYDVTTQLRAGANSIGVLLGNGMYNVPNTPNRYTKFTGSLGEPKLIAQLRVEFADGTSTLVTSGADWKTTPGPVVYSHTYGGEDFDARQEPTGWLRPGFDDSKWQPARAVSGPGGRLIAEQNPPIRVIRTYRPVKVTRPKPGLTVYDLGQNFSGWPRITVSGPAGASVKLIPGECLAADGTVSQVSSGRPQWYTYTLSGRGQETWAPRFSYYGQRYVQVETTSPGVKLAALSGEFIHAAAPVVGEFSCSSDLFNRIHALINAAIRSNMQSVLSDCPHREKLGWLEQSHLAGPSILYNYDASRLYSKIADDIRDSQLPDGLVPDIAPEYVVFRKGFRDSPEWGSAAILNPWLVYTFTGDARILAAHYPEMKRYAAYLASKSDNGILAYGLGDWCDIGPKSPGVSQLTSFGITATGIYYADLLALERTARVLGETADAARYRDEAARLRETFNAKFFSAADSKYDRGSQTSSAMPLVLGLAPEASRAALLERLVADVRANSNRTTAGDIGYHFVVAALGEGSRSDVVHDILATTSGPGYGYQLAQGATALTEAWDANPKLSQNHFMLGHVEEWFYRYLAGIDFDLTRPAAERITLRPTPVGNITSARATYRSVLGPITASWKRDAGVFTYHVELPPNVTATLYLPGEKEARKLGSGSHHFSVGSGTPATRQPRSAN
jgi:hypothetical protein